MGSGIGNDQTGHAGRGGGGKQRIFPCKPLTVIIGDGGHEEKSPQQNDDKKADSDYLRISEFDFFYHKKKKNGTMQAYLKIGRPAKAHDG